VNKKKYIKVTQIHSTAGRLPVHKACLKGLGLRRIRHTVQVEDTPAVRGMINKAIFLLKVEDVK
jgi:large subunit ribosomal protein L30